MKNSEINRRDSFDKFFKWDFIERQGITNGTVHMKVYDGAGKSHLKKSVFAGNVLEVPSQHSNTNEYNPKQEWSNGSDTRKIEAKLRATKKKIGYIEPKALGIAEDTQKKTPLTLYRDATRGRDRAWFIHHLGKDYMSGKEIHHNWKRNGYPIVITHQEHVELHKEDGRWGGKRTGAGRPFK